MKKTITIQRDLLGLLEAADKILNSSPSSGPVIEAIKQRIKWKGIQDDYSKLREKNVKSRIAFEALSKKYHYSTKNIEAIIYER